MGNGGDPDEVGAYASPPCFLHELDPSYLGVASSREPGDRPGPGAGREQRARLLPERAFPPYAYLSGRSPHPVRDPAGHSYDQGVAVPLDRDAFWWGVDLFNHGYYWEAHEAWEPLWRAAEQHGSRRHILKGLILLAAAGIKLRQRKPGAAGRHGRRAVTHFRQAERVLDCRLEPTLGLSPAVLARQGELATAAAPDMALSQSDPEIVFRFTLRVADPLLAL